MSAYDPNNIFAKILRREIPCQPVYEDDFAFAFHDIHPQASIHVLVIPKGAYVSIADFSALASADEITGFHRAVAATLDRLGGLDSGFRCIANTGVNAGQEVPHYHLHILGGNALGPMLTKKSI